MVDYLDTTVKARIGNRGGGGLYATEGYDGMPGDGVTNERTALQQLAAVSMPAAGGAILVSVGTHLIDAGDLDLDKRVILNEGALLKPGSGRTIKVRPDAGPYKIFDTSAGGMVELADVPVVYPAWWTGKPDGTTDMAPGSEAALQAWAGITVLDVGHEYPADFVFTPGHWWFENGISADATAIRLGGRIKMHGALLELDPTVTDFLDPESAGNYLITIDCNHGYLWRNVLIEGGHLEGGGLYLKNGPVAVGDDIYGFIVRGVNIEKFQGHGIWVERAFEGIVETCHIESEGNTLGNCINVTDNVSSIQVNWCSTRGGLYGLYADNVDLSAYGGTYLHAQNEGVRIENWEGGVLSGLHVENNWKSAASIATGGAGLTAIGWGTIIGIKGDGNDKQRRVVDVYAANMITIIGGLKQGTIVDYAQLNGLADSTVTLIGVQDYVTAAGWLSTNRGNVVQLGANDTGVTGLELIGNFAHTAGKKFGIFGATPADKPVAGTELIAALASLGLIVDADTPLDLGASTLTAGNIALALKLFSIQSSANNVLIQTQVSGDTHARHNQLVSGTTQAGPGNAGADVTWGRTSVGTFGVGSDDAIRTGFGATGARPSAVTVGAGGWWYDTTLAKPIFSDGTVWRDAAGTAV